MGTAYPVQATCAPLDGWRAEPAEQLRLAAHVTGSRGEGRSLGYR